MHSLVNAQMVEEFQRDGIVLIKGLFKDQVDLLRLGVDKNMTSPGPYAAENLKQGEQGRFLMIIAIGAE